MDLVLGRHTLVALLFLSTNKIDGIPYSYISQVLPLLLPLRSDYGYIIRSITVGPETVSSRKRLVKSSASCGELPCPCFEC